MTAIKPKFGIFRQEAGERACSQPLHACRPDHRLQSMLNVQFRNALIVEQADCSNSIAGIVDLMAALELRQAQIKQAIFILEDQSAMLLKGLPILVGNEDGSAGPFSDAFNFCPRFIGLHADDCGNVFLQDARFLMGDGSECIPEILLMVIVNGCNNGKYGLCNDIGCIKPAAQAYFKNEKVCRSAREGQKRRRRGDFKKSNCGVAIGNFAFFQQGR
jgi:hypothetical protein